MRRIEWVQARLNNWALWRAREASGGLGFATRSVLLANPVDESRGCDLPIDDTDASVTDDAVLSLKTTAPHLYEVLGWYYIKGAGIKGTAAALGRAESTVAGNLGQADYRLAAWFTDRKERHAAQKNSFTS